jgi:hypothetical protein
MWEENKTTYKCRHNTLAVKLYTFLGIMISSFAEIKQIALCKGRYHMELVITLHLFLRQFREKQRSSEDLYFVQDLEEWQSSYL